MYLRLHILISTIHDSHDLHSNLYFYYYLYHFMEERARINDQNLRNGTSLGSRT